jgi:hypothetical protein
MPSPEVQTNSPEIRLPVDVRTVIEIYIATEMHRAFPTVGTFEAFLEGTKRFGTQEIWNWLKATAFTVRLNGLFWMMSSEGNSWSRTTLNAEQITLTGIKPHIDRIVNSPKITGSAVKFAQYLGSYFAANPTDDPEELNEFRPSGEVGNPVLIVTKSQDTYSLVDGAHRLMVLLLSGQTQIDVFVAEKTKSGQVPLSGVSAFFEFLRSYYHAKTEAEKSAVLTVLFILLRISADAEEGLERIWIKGQPPEIAAAAQNVFEEYKKQRAYATTKA